MRALYALIACILGALAVLQLGSMALFSSAAVRGSFPAHISRSFGQRIYRGLEGVMPSDTVEAMLARDDLSNFKFGDVPKRIAHMKPGPERSELQAQLARSRGETEGALRSYLAADDVNALQFEVDRLAAGGRLANAYKFERRIVEHLSSQTTHPDALAEAWWRLGQLASRLRLDNAQNDYEHALALAPFSEKYLLAAGFQALALGNFAAASTYFTRGIDVNPASAEAYAGLGQVALASGDRARSMQFASRSRSLNARTTALRELEDNLRK